VGESILMVPKLEKARRACLGSSVMIAGPGRRGVRHRTVDDTSARAFDTSFAGRGTTIIRKWGLHLTGAAQVSALPPESAWQGLDPGRTCGFCSVDRRSTPAKWRARIRNMRGMIRSSAADALEARVTRYE
jgi:hypothetical protein